MKLALPLYRHCSTSTSLLADMDRGAARSRKQEERSLEGNPTKQVGGPSARTRPQISQEAQAQAGPSATKSDTTREPYTSRFKPKIIDNTDPARFRPKAIRDSAALIWSQGEFPLPPPNESLAKVTRVDLTGSDCTDVSWLKGTNVTWLSLKGCKIHSGWDAVGSLTDLTGKSAQGLFKTGPQGPRLTIFAVLNISETGLQRLPAPLTELRNLKALVAMGNPWTEIDSDVMDNWDQLNSLSECAEQPNGPIHLKLTCYQSPLTPQISRECQRRSAGFDISRSSHSRTALDSRHLVCPT